ncbi:MAG: protein-glutamate O-methyltransferase [Desulfovibrionaceae bacterium]|nr:protein-glutamate O-methyltransferase [Desulfovibrionaceae bacterium]
MQDKQAVRPALQRQAMKEREFRRFSEFLHQECGIKLPASKKTLLEARLQKRLRELGMAHYKDYCEYVFSCQGLEEELPRLIDVVTTNTTDFFREPRHFEFLVERVLPEWLSRSGLGQALKVWSAGCSTGEEPYTLAMVLSEFAERRSGFRFQVQATDICNQALGRAVNAVYPEERTAPIPTGLKRKYLLRSRDRSKKLVRVGPEIRGRVCFKRLNFMGEYDFPEKMDVIFCRNVLIYFDRPTQEFVLGRFCEHLRRGGYLFIGHSESLAGMALPLSHVAPTIYSRL